VSLPLERVEAEIVRLWEAEAKKSEAPRVELATLIALVAEPELLESTRRAASSFACRHPSRTIVASWRAGTEATIVADVALHRATESGAACGDAISLDATGGAREWLPENAQRLALPDLPVCLWWVGDLPDFDRLFNRTLSLADLVVVDSGTMDLRDLEALADIVAHSRGEFALSDFAWQRLRPIQELVARFFDDEHGRACLAAPQRIVVRFARTRVRGVAPVHRGGRELPEDAASTEAGLLLGWIAHALGLPVDEATWTRGEGWAEVTLGSVVARFERCERNDVRPGTLLGLAMHCGAARFELERLDDPCVMRWSRDVPGAQVPPQTLRVSTLDEPSMLVGCVQRPRRDALLEACLSSASRVVRAVAPRLG
jgi:glucose-6-phosphate dehydrogenase assembly protein OpcA